MQARVMVDKYFRARYLAFKWRYSLTQVNKLTLAFGITCLTGLAAQIRMSLPWTPVPITGQTFAVLIAGVLLGKRWGGISQILYVAMGAAGVPWFAGWSGGYGVIAGPTGGYIIGFILAALFIGHFTNRYIKVRSFPYIFVLMLFANFVLIHGLGLLQLSLWLSLAKGTQFTLWQLLQMGSIPFIPGDLTKVVLAAAMAKVITPKEAFNGEVDA